MMSLKNKTALVTGAASGIGREIALAYAAADAVVVCADRDVAGSEQTAATIRAAGGAASAVECDVASASAIDAAVTAAEQLTGRLDILLNAAGIMRSQSLLEITRDSFQATLDVNLLGLFFMLQAAAKTMIRLGNGGRIINIASIAGRRGIGDGTQYCASKAAVISVTQSAALALAEHGINVNAIAPGYIRTGMWTQIERHFSATAGVTAETFNDGMAGTVAAKRLGTPQDLAGMALFLASDASAYVIGQTFNVDGGVFLN